MAVLTTLPTLTCPHFAARTPSEDLHRRTTMTITPQRLPEEKNKVDVAIKNISIRTVESTAVEEMRKPTPDETVVSPTTNESSPTASGNVTPTRPLHRLEAEIEARLARIPGYMGHSDAAAYTLDPERIARLRKAQGEAMEELKTSMVFRQSDELAAALADIERRKMWEDLKVWD